MAFEKPKIAKTIKMSLKTGLVTGMDPVPDAVCNVLGIPITEASKVIPARVDELLRGHDIDKWSENHITYAITTDDIGMTYADIVLIVSSDPSGEVEGWPGVFVVTDKTAVINDGSGRTWADLETVSQKFIDIAGTFYIGTAALHGGLYPAKGTELVAIGQQVIPQSDFITLLV